jgi:hypothetical protein
MQEFAIVAAQVCTRVLALLLRMRSYCCYIALYFQDAIANFTTEQEIAASIKSKFEAQYPAT